MFNETKSNSCAPFNRQINVINDLIGLTLSTFTKRLANVCDVCPTDNIIDGYVNELKKLLISHFH